MSTCLFCSTISSPSIYEPNCRWRTATNPNIIRPVQFALPTRNSSWAVARVFQDEGVGVLFPDESVSLREISSDGERNVDGGMVNGLAETVEEKEGSLSSSKDLVRRRYVKKREAEEEEDGYSRFKLRNGKQVYGFELLNTFVLFLGGCDSCNFAVEI